MILERDVESFFRKRIEDEGGICLKLLTNYSEGLPDRLAILPGGKVAFVELKRPKGGRLSPMQVYQHKRLKDLGCTVRVIRNIQEANEFVDELKAGGGDEV